MNICLPKDVNSCTHAVMDNQKWTRSAECVRAALAFAALGTLSMFFLFPAVFLLHYPKSFSETGVLIEGSVVTLLGSYDTLWYSQSSISKVNSSVDYNYTAQLFLQNCSDLQPDSNSSSVSFTNLTITTKTHIPIAETLSAYYVSGSLVKITLLLSQVPATGSGSLYLFDNYSDFVSFQSEQELVPTSYALLYPISLVENITTTFSFIFNNTGFYFFGLYLPSNTNFLYNLSYTQLFYNPTNFFAPACSLNLYSNECQVALNSSERHACLLIQPNGGTELFTTLNVHISHKMWNAVNTFLLALFASSFMLCVSVPLYYWWVLRVRPRLVARWSRKQGNNNNNGHYYQIN